MGALMDRTGLVPFDARDALGVALRLAFGMPRPEDARADWALVLDASSRELLSTLAWTRSGLFIRRHAGPDLASVWRRSAVAAHVRGEIQLGLLRDAIRALDAADVDAVVLKGLPLGERLYGSPFVRCSADIDLYVPAAQRERAASTLRRLAWRSTDGAAPWHESWSVAHADAEYHLELHSLLVSDHLAHLRTPAPVAARECVAGVELPAHVGDFVAPYLAAHLATHQLPPLLWLVDFATLRRSSSDAAWARAETAARAAGLGEYLTWACERAELVERVAANDWDALGALGIDGAGRRDLHSIWRHLALAATHRDRLRLIGAFLVPHRVRGNARSFLRYTMARLRTRLRSLAGASREYGHSSFAAGGTDAASPARALRLERHDLVTLTRDVVGAGGALHVRAPGGSMLPTIPRGALVRIGPVPAVGIVAGDVVLALTSDGEPVLHRAVTVRRDGIVMRGDAAVTTDPPVPHSSVIGVATHVHVDGVERPLGRRPRRSITVSALMVRRRLARMVRRAR
jgi:hypothetical protein